MSYLVLARKWRPQVFDHVVGQPHVTRTLQNAIKTGRIAHAYLFTGARGVGKTSVARILAKALNCQKGISPVPCNECSNCREISQGNAVDVLEIDGASNRGIDSIRELRDTVRYRPAKSSYKIYIIDEVHMLTTEAFNALLKTLEEPPEHVLFIFATTEPHKIPGTILSRCQRYDFRRIPTRQILAHLARIAQEEGADFSQSVLFAVAREADGSMRDAQSLMEQLLAFRGEDLEDREVLDLLGVVDRETVREAAQAVLDRDVTRCLDLVDRLHGRGIDLRRFCQRLCEYFRDLMVLSFGRARGGSWLDLPQEELQGLEALVSRTSGEALFSYFQMLVAGEEDIRRASLPRVALEMLLLRLATLPCLESIDAVLERLEGLVSGSAAPLVEDSPPRFRVGRKEPPKEGLSGAPKPPCEERCQGPAAREERRNKVSQEAFAGVREDEPEGAGRTVSRGDAAGQEESVDPDSGSLEPADVVRHWSDFCQWVAARDQILGAKLSKSRAVEEPQGVLAVQVLEVFETSVQNGDSERTLRQHLTHYFRGKKAAFPIRFSATKAAIPKPSQAGSRKTSPTRLALNHPAVQQAIEVLGGELVEVRSLKSKKKDR
ncbi:DNA polymerase III, tau subunit [Desulfacinum hydrothermale DSM 13146]|uniref:DNA polymerase III subunit gamma/tau n=1 Tax=Desulfacinum hydrothermale DSM 13146 TaxID=1121390 RepID=A0A1W1XIM4_9BACT|nr:DNA polymerase III subunit gamma/tau [Desulfacinum hydrothermale]SMC23348.1 DNA polymerase III, tau subunit [Desulfacinum hydrothermale DSM 13146]